MISIHAPARGATAIWAILHCKVKFQSTLPRGERQDASMTDVSTWQFQSTLPRGERRTLPFSSPHAHQISIHAPARGATSVKCFVIRMVKFQSTLPRGERLITANKLIRSFAISIHAPARGATNIVHYHMRRILHFNPRSREGSDKRI